jgi:lipopolysaccharide export LptBFGC system permease protein LptF
MKRFGRLISGYLIRTIFPYFVFSWLLLSVILFVQQAGRFSDIFFNVNIPATLVWQLMIALVPNVIAFTCPMAVLVGTVIGLAKLQGDSELVAIRAAGVGNLQITIPIVILGIVLSVFAFFVNLEGVPLAARLVRKVALQTAIQKLESPIEPGVFNTDISGYTVYVKTGDITSGHWQNIFVYHEDPAAGTLRLITSKQGRIDVAGQSSELVLENATVTTLPMTAGQGKYVSENIGDLRLAIKTKRNEMIDRLTTAQGSPEELGLSELSEYAATRDGADRIEAQILWQRRLILSVTPLIFCLLGSALMLRFNRGGRGFGTFLALVSLVIYYLLAFLGEQLARVGTVSAFGGGMIPIAASALLIVWFHFSRRIGIFSYISEFFSGFSARFIRRKRELQFRNLFIDLTTGLRDLDLLINLSKYFFLTLAFLGILSTIFTAFELWKFAGAMDGGTFLLAKYLFYLLPFLYLQYLAPTAAMLGILATYVIKSRQNEIVTWISAGQSVYRLLAPCFLATLLLGGVNWVIQEQVLPTANLIQDELRTEIRSKGVVANKGGKYWLYVNNQIISFESPLASDNVNAPGSNILSTSKKQDASDNEQQLSRVRVYQFASSGPNLQALYQAESAVWTKNNLGLNGPVTKSELINGQVKTSSVSSLDIPEDEDPLVGVSEKPSYLDRAQLKDRVDQAESDTERRMFAVALQKRYSTPFLPLIIALFTAPFALSLSRTGKVITIGGAIGLWLLYIGSTSVFEQFGLNGFLPAGLAVWAPLALFSALGVYLLSHVRT